jgi:putative salt-induced outer membrane protein YdiY
MMSKTTALALFLIGFATLSFAEQVTLKNGDRLTGAVLSMDGKKLVVKTSYAGEVAIDWAEVSKFESDKPLVITRTDKQVLSGTVATEGPDVMITTAQGPQKLPLADVSAMRSPADQAAYEKSLNPGMLQGWTGGGSFGFALARGNSETTNLALGFDALRKTSKDAWIVDAASIYSTDAKTNTTSANSFQGSIRYDHNLTKRVFAYGIFAGGYDTLQSLNYRILPGGGLGFHAIASERTTLDLLGGFGYTRESYYTGLTRNLITATLGDEFAYKITKNTSFTQNLYYLPALNDTSIYRVTGNVGLATKLNGWLTSNLNFNDRYNSAPVLGNKKNDVLFTAGLGFTFGAKPAK